MDNQYDQDQFDTNYNNNNDYLQSLDPEEYQAELESTQNQLKNNQIYIQKMQNQRQNQQYQNYSQNQKDVNQNYDQIQFQDQFQNENDNENFEQQQEYYNRQIQQLQQQQQQEYEQQQQLKQYQQLQQQNINYNNNSNQSQQQGKFQKSQQIQNFSANQFKSIGNNSNEKVYQLQRTSYGQLSPSQFQNSGSFEKGLSSLRKSGGKSGQLQQIQLKQNLSVYSNGKNNYDSNFRDQQYASEFSVNQNQNQNQCQNQNQDQDQINNTNNQEISNEQVVQNQSNDIKQQIRIIFVFYASFGDRTNITYLKSSRFHKLMEDAQITDQILNKKKLDLIFFQENKHKANMTFQVFLNLLPKIANIKYSEFPPEKAILELFFNHLQPLNQSILQETDLGQDLEAFGQSIDMECIEIMKSVSKTLIGVFKVYFPWEEVNSLQHKDLIDKTQQALFKFLKEYDICPLTITQSIAYLLFNDLIDTPVEFITHNIYLQNKEFFGFKDKGKLFSIYRFFVYLIRCAQIGYSKYQNPNMPYNTQAEKLNALLERMELSEGFMNIEKKTHKTHNQSTSLLMPAKLIQKLNMEGSLDIGLVKSQRLSQLSKTKSQMQLQQSTSKVLMESKVMSRCRSPQRSQIKSKLLDSLKFQMDILPVLQKYSEPLQRLFKYYCSFGEPLNTSTLKSIKLQKMFKDAGLLSENKVQNRTGYKGYQKSFDNNRSNLLQQSYRTSIAESQNFQSRKLSVIDLDFIFSKLTGHGWIKKYNKNVKGFSSSIQSPSLGFSNYQYKNQIIQGAKGKLEYEHFVKCLEETCSKLYPEYDTEQGLAIIVEKHLLPLEKQIMDDKEKARVDYLELLMRILKDEDLVEILSQVHHNIFAYYKHYCDSKQQMNIQQFLQFAQEFEIFPDLLSKAKLHQMFFAMASMHKNNEDQEIQQQQQLQSQILQNNNSQSLSRIEKIGYKISQDQPEEDLIDMHLFIELTALIAVEVYQNEKVFTYRYLMFIERINSSNGRNTLQKRIGYTRSTTGLSWDMLQGIRQKYKEFYQINQKKSKLFTPGNFENAICNALNNNQVQYKSQVQNEQENQMSVRNSQNSNYKYNQKYNQNQSQNQSQNDFNNNKQYYSQQSQDQQQLQQNYKMPQQFQEQQQQNNVLNINEEIQENDEYLNEQDYQ